MSVSLNRRVALSRFAGAAALAIPASAIPATADPHDAELVALSAEIVHRSKAAQEHRQTRINIHDERFEALMFDSDKSVTTRWNEAWTYNRESGREAAVVAATKYDQATDRMFDRLLAILATTQAGRAAKVRALLVHVMQDGWRGPAKELDYDVDMARRLLGEFAGMSAAELEAC